MLKLSFAISNVCRSFQNIKNTFLMLNHFYSQITIHKLQVLKASPLRGEVWRGFFQFLLSRFLSAIV